MSRLPVDRLFRAFSDRTRLRILHLLQPGRSPKAIAATAATLLLGTMMALAALQSPAVRAVDEKVLREYTGVYQWAPDSFVAT